MSETFQPPEKMWKLAVKRCSDFPLAALNLQALGQDFLETLMVSCYLAGVEDGVHVTRSRREGDYEEKR